MKVYVSGKITGCQAKEVKKKFSCASDLLKLKGYIPVNPLDLPIPKPISWEDFMINDIKHLFLCDGIYMLKDWGQSKGARIEYAIAKELGIKIFFEGEFN
jgi:hypothetical protein